MFFEKCKMYSNNLHAKSGRHIQYWRIKISGKKKLPFRKNASECNRFSQNTSSCQVIYVSSLKHLLRGSRPRRNTDILFLIYLSSARRTDMDESPLSCSFSGAHCDFCSLVPPGNRALWQVRS